MNQALRDQHLNQGAIFASTDEFEYVKSFGQDEAALVAAESGVALCDRSHWGRIEIGDRDCKSFLHNQSSNDIQGLAPGQGCETVILTSTARTIDLVEVYCADESLLMLVSPNRRRKLMEWLDRYIFFNDRVSLSDVTEATACFRLIGPESEQLLTSLGVTELPQAKQSHQRTTIQTYNIQIVKGAGLVSDGFTLIVAAEDSAAVWELLAHAGAVPLGETVWETLRIQQGRPKPDAELTEDFNPLEAGLWHTVSFDKGCYIGQETIARLNTYDGVKQKLWALELEQPVESGTPILLDGKKVGVVTSVLRDSMPPIALGYVKSKAGGEGSTVSVQDQMVLIKAVPYLTRSPLPE